MIFLFGFAGLHYSAAAFGGMMSGARVIIAVAHITIVGPNAR